MSDLIMDSGNVAENTGFEEAEDFADLTATTTADPQTMDFHIQMRGYTMRDFETMVVQAAAQQLVAGRTFKSEIQAEAIRQANEKLNSEVTDALRDVMKITVMQRGKDTISLAQMIGLEAKDYLTASVRPNTGEPADGWSDSVPRIQFLAKQVFEQQFKAMLEAAAKELKSELAAAVSAHIQRAIDDKRAEIAKAVGYEITNRR
jgi:hypothetical protein